MSLFYIDCPDVRISMPTRTCKTRYGVPGAILFLAVSRFMRQIVAFWEVFCPPFRRAYSMANMNLVLNVSHISMGLRTFSPSYIMDTADADGAERTGVDNVSGLHYTGKVS